MGTNDLATKLKGIFKEFDTDQSSTISRERLTSTLRQLDPTFTDEELDVLFELADKNGNGVIEYDEFVDFICYLEKPKDKMLDCSLWVKALTTGTKVAFAADTQASAIRNIVINFPDLEPTSPEGLTLAEEFILFWQDNESGEFSDYGYFGSDEPYHNALFGATLLGLKARKVLELKERKCAYLGNYCALQLTGDAPEDSEVLKATYEEIASKPDNSLKMWFEQKSGKWGQDKTTKLAITALVNRGILEDGDFGDTFKKAAFKTKDTEVEEKIRQRMKSACSGEAEADNRTIALLALCRTADMRDITTNVMMTNIFGKGEAEAMAGKVDELLKTRCKFHGFGVEEMNKLIDALPKEEQTRLCGDDFWNASAAKFKELDISKTGNFTEDEAMVAVKDILPEKLLDKLKEAKFDTCSPWELTEADGSFTMAGMTLTEEDAEVVVSAVEDGSAAAEAGVKAGDRLTSVSSKAVTGHHSLKELITEAQATGGAPTWGFTRREHVDPQNLRSIIIMFDFDNDGVINEQEFIGFCVWAEVMKKYVLNA